MIYIYVWFEQTGWAFDPPTEEDIACINAGHLTVLSLVGIEIPRDYLTQNKVERCLTDDTPEGNRYHYVP